SEGIAHNQPVDPGFASVEFSRTLVPAAERLGLAEVAPGTFPSAPQDRQQYFVWIPEGAGRLDLKISVKKVWANRMPKITLYSPKEVTLNAVSEDSSYKPDGAVNDLSLKTPHGGLHRVETVDGGDH